jgi:hypothetical protein
MPERNIDGDMTEHGDGRELPVDNTAKQNAKGQGTAKPFDQWTVEDFLAAGVNVTRSDAKHRVTNTGTSVTGTKRTGIAIGTTFHKGFKFAK